MKIDQQWVRTQLHERLGEVIHAGVMSEVLRRMDETDGDFAAIAEAVERDPYLTARVLAMANLTAGGGAPVATLDRAVQMLGVRQVHALTISALLIAMAKRAVATMRERAGRICRQLPSFSVPKRSGSWYIWYPPVIRGGIIAPVL